MLKLIAAVKAFGELIANRDWKSIPGAAADLLDALGKTEQAALVRETAAAVDEADAREIAIGIGNLVYDVLEGYYGFAPVTVKAVPYDADEELSVRATALTAHMEGHARSKMTATPRVAAIPDEVLAVIANVLSTLILNFLRKRGV